MLKIPYGISNFAAIATENYYFVDRTHYLEKLDNLGEKYIFYLRPRRFGKSLWISIMQYYYGIEYQSQFTSLFGKYYIGQNPTPLANQYLILRFDFSRIDTRTPESSYFGFWVNVKMGVSDLMNTYSTYFTDTQKTEILNKAQPEVMLKELLKAVKATSPYKIYLLIDEYDHFANELLALNLTHFKEIVGRNGWVRKFYETIKTATGEGIVDRLFVTGVCPATLDSMTSGFNITSSLTLNASFHAMMGFKAYEVSAILENIGIQGEQLPAIMEQMRLWYDGFKICEDAKEHLYNPDMVLYFAKEYVSTGGYPRRMLDVNIASDYGKIKSIFEIDGKEAERVPLLEKIVSDGKISTKLVERFNFELGFGKQDFLSLLFYMGMLSIEDVDLDAVVLRTPNYVMRELYYEYYYKLLEDSKLAPVIMEDVKDAIRNMAKYKDLSGFKALVEGILAAHSIRDKANFSEKHIKTLIITLFYISEIYMVDSEPETNRNYMDILLVGRFQYKVPYNFLFELKYAKKATAEELEKLRQDAILQLTSYRNTPKVQNIERLHAFILIVVDKELRILEEIV